jgi:hypothetical protein
VAGNCSGTIPSTNYCVNYLKLGASTFDNAALSDPAAFVNEFALPHNYDGAQMTSGRQTFNVQSTLAPVEHIEWKSQLCRWRFLCAGAASGHGGTSTSSDSTSKGASSAPG